MLEPKTLKRLGALALLAGAGCLCACSTTAGVAPGRSTAPRAAPSTPSAKADVGPVHTERLPVRFGDVKQLASMLESIFDADLRRQGEVRAILVDHATDELVVVGTDAGIERVRNVLRPGCSLDADRQDELVDVVYLEHTEAASVLRLVGPVTDRPTMITADAATNALVVRGDPEAIAKLKKTVAAIDVPRQR